MLSSMQSLGEKNTFLGRDLSKRRKALLYCSINKIRTFLKFEILK